MTGVRPARSVVSTVAGIGLAVVLLFVIARVQRSAQAWLMQSFGHLSPWMLWTLVVVVPAIPVGYVLIVWLRSRRSTSSTDSKEDR